MGRAKLGFLKSGRDIAIRQRGIQLLALVPDHNHGALEFQFRKAVEQMHQHRASSNRMKHLVQGAFHAGSLAGSKNYGGEIAIGFHDQGPCHHSLAV